MRADPPAGGGAKSKMRLWRAEAAPLAYNLNYQFRLLHRQLAVRND
ncbi:MAG TPA: hypothetical protein VGD14_13480 [bacterium]